MAGLHAEKKKKREQIKSAFHSQDGNARKQAQEIVKKKGQEKKRKQKVEPGEAAQRSAEGGDEVLTVSRQEQMSVKKNLQRLKNAIAKLERMLTGAEDVRRDEVGRGIDAIAAMACAV